MSVKMITFPGQVRTALDDAIVYRSAVSTGVLRGFTCEIDSNSNNTIRVAIGYALIQGRLIESNSVVSLQIPYATTGTLNGKVFLKANLSNTSAPAEIIYRTASGVPIPTQDDDINNGGTYEMELCSFVISTSAITSLTNTTNVVPIDAPKIYTRVSQLGLTAPATVTDIVAAVPYGGICFIGAEEIDSSTLPSNGGGVLEVANLSGTAVRGGKTITFKQGKGNLTYNDARMYINSSGEPIGTWYDIPKATNVFHQPGEMVTLTCQGGGFVTASGTSLRYFLNYSKLKGSVSGATLVDGGVIARQNGKYIAGDSNGSMWLEPEHTTLTLKENGIMVSVTESGGFSNAINNAPAAIYSNVTVLFS